MCMIFVNRIEMVKEAKSTARQQKCETCRRETERACKQKGKNE